MYSLSAERNGGVISYLCWRLWKGGARPLQETRLTGQRVSDPQHLNSFLGIPRHPPSRRTRRFRAPGHRFERSWNRSRDVRTKAFSDSQYPLEF
ncbi:hypothetical protein CDAR_441281 [Caerostris darwini]|uniref:Uncharacterized protein n=1 Tax=Caerostris darwini TaxID=1538125 RepID=A0AAV4TRT3_9ARAC|nr:hypothetical protein CDAR_441281 [Caerostris darwini]